MPITHFDAITGLTLYVLFDDGEDTAVALTEGTGSKLHRYFCTDNTILSAGLDSSSSPYSATIREGDWEDPQATDEIKGVISGFYWNGSIELPSAANITKVNGITPASNSGRLAVDTTYVMGRDLTDYITDPSLFLQNAGTFFVNADIESEVLLSDIGSGEFPDLTGTGLTNFQTFFNNGGASSTVIINEVDDAYDLMNPLIVSGAFTSAALINVATKNIQITVP